jgi:hypothetical protein
VASSIALPFGYRLTWYDTYHASPLRMSYAIRNGAGVAVETGHASGYADLVRAVRVWLVRAFARGVRRG